MRAKMMKMKVRISKLLLRFNQNRQKIRIKLMNQMEKAFIKSNKVMTMKRKMFMRNAKTRLKFYLNLIKIVKTQRMRL